MGSIFDLRPANFNSIPVTTKSMCMNMAKVLQAEAYAPASIQRKPSLIAKSVLELKGRGLSGSERRQLPFMILDPRFDEFQNEFADEVFSNYAKSDRFWARLFRAWISDFNLARPVSELVVKHLNKNLGKLPAPMRNLASRYPLVSIHPDFTEAARSLLNGEMSRDDKVDLGLSSDGEVTTRLADLIIQACAARLSQNEGSLEQLAEFEKLVAPRHRIHESLKLHAMIGLILGAERRSPGETAIKGIANLIENNFDDPVTGKSNWPYVPDSLGGIQARERCLDTVRKWRVFRSITLFFKIIEQVVESEHKHQFPIRRDFWLKYFDKGVVQDAWVILGSKAQSQMLRLKQQNEDYEALKWASLSGGPSDQCALLMKLGDTTVMEFSHSGRVRMWGKKDGSTEVRSGVPVLHRSTYKADDLRADCPKSQMFTHDQYGNWRVSADQCIARLTGRGGKL
jgi:hypothetical protein